MCFRSFFNFTANSYAFFCVQFPFRDSLEKRLSCPKILNFVAHSNLQEVRIQAGSSIGLDPVSQSHRYDILKPRKGLITSDCFCLLASHISRSQKCQNSKVCIVNCNDIK